MPDEEKNIKRWTDDLTRMDLYTKIQSVDSKVALVGKDVDNIKEGILRIEKYSQEVRNTYATKEQLQTITDAILRLEKANSDEKDTYVTRTEFVPVKTAVYGLISIILTSVILAIVGLVLYNKTNA